MSFLPDWNSVESTARWSDILFWAGIVCLVLLAVTEVASHVYGTRSSFLSGDAARLADQKRTQGANAAEARRKAEVEGLQNKLAEADKKVGDLQKQQPQRRLTDAQKAALVAAMMPFPGQKLSITCIMGDIYGKEFADDLIAVAKAAKWDVSQAPNQAVYMQDPVGVIVSMNEKERNEGRMPAGLPALANTFIALGLLPNKTVVTSPDVAEGTIAVIVGKKS